MSEGVKHTQGEWEVDNAPAADGYDINTNGDKWKHIATAKANSDGAAEVSDDEALANAYLMAAAPDLLAACERLLANLDPTAAVNTNFSDYIAIRNAVTRAKGES